MAKRKRFKPSDLVQRPKQFGSPISAVLQGEDLGKVTEFMGRSNAGADIALGTIPVGMVGSIGKRVLPKLSRSTFGTAVVRPSVPMTNSKHFMKRNPNPDEFGITKLVRPVKLKSGGTIQGFNDPGKTVLLGRKNNKRFTIDAQRLDPDDLVVNTRHGAALADALRRTGK